MRRSLAVQLALAATAVLAAVLSSGATAATSAPKGDDAVRARFACYPARFSPFRAQSRTITDKPSGIATVSLVVPETVCAPAPGPATSYLTCYTLSVANVGTTPRPVRVSDEFAKSFSVIPSKLLTLCLPSARVDAGGSSSQSKDLDSFSCYAAKAAVVSHQGVSVVDDFATSQDTLGAPFRLCAPAAAKGGKVFDSSRFLGCYSDQSATTGKIIVLHNEFGYFKAALGARGWLCATATLS
jgi:hypothetical protein